MFSTNLCFKIKDDIKSQAITDSEKWKRQDQIMDRIIYYIEKGNDSRKPVSSDELADILLVDLSKQEDFVNVMKDCSPEYRLTSGNVHYYSLCNLLKKPHFFLAIVMPYVLETASDAPREENH